MGTIVDHVEAAYDAIEAGGRPEVWIYLVPRAEAVQAAATVEAAVAAGRALPLAGVTLAVKDNIDVAGIATTAACPTYAEGPAPVSAPVIEALLAAGAVLIGKTNLDQFATGLVGTRSPYGAVRNAVDPAYVSGGSSSGSAVAVALGYADLALGTDTAGSGRVPAAFNGIVGLKPTRGLVSTRGVVPACLSFDCVSIFARTVELATRALSVVAQPDDEDPGSRAARPVPRLVVPASGATIGVPPLGSLELDPPEAACFASAVARVRALGATIVEVDLAPFTAAGRLLYGGGFVAERYASVGAFLETDPSGLDPTVETIIRTSRDIPAHRLASDIYELRRLRRVVQHAFTDLDAVLLPTAPSIPTIAEVQADPLGANTRLGRFTTPCNLLDLCAIAIPAGTTPDGLPFGVALHAPAFHDDHVAALAASMLAESPPAAAASDAGRVELAVAGAHLSGQPLNHQLTEPGGVLVETTTTSADYRLFALDTAPPKPGLVHRPGDGAAIEVEVWSMPLEAFARFVAAVPAPLAIGSVTLADGRSVPGFTCMPHGLDSAKEITEFGGWRAYLASIAGT
jgi:allophanate hydrolase